jgi:hypothetical protein
MSADINDAIRTIVEGMTDEQRDDLTKKLYDAAEGVIQAVSERTPYLILEQEARETSELAKSIMKGGER